MAVALGDQHALDQRAVAEPEAVLSGTVLRLFLHLGGEPADHSMVGQQTADLLVDLNHPGEIVQTGPIEIGKKLVAARGGQTQPRDKLGHLAAGEISQINHGIHQSG